MQHVARTSCVTEERRPAKALSGAKGDRRLMLPEVFCDRGRGAQEENGVEEWGEKEEEEDEGATCDEGWGGRNDAERIAGAPVSSYLWFFVLGNGENVIRNMSSVDGVCGYGG
jgi:hypothetical protein